LFNISTSAANTPQKIGGENSSEERCMNTEVQEGKQTEEQTDEQVRENKYLLFKLGEEEYGVNISAVQSIEEMPEWLISR
jgi:hypothetical protein